MGPAQGAPWRDLPERYGPVGTVSSWFYRRCQSVSWQRILSALQVNADVRGELDWDLNTGFHDLADSCHQSSLWCVS